MDWRLLTRRMNASNFVICEYLEVLQLPVSGELSPSPSVMSELVSLSVQNTCFSEGYYTCFILHLQCQVVYY